VPGVALDGVDGAEVPSVAALLLLPVPGGYLHVLLGLLGAREDDAVLGSHEELRRASLLHPLQRDTTESLRLFAAIRQRALVEDFVILRTSQNNNRPSDDTEAHSELVLVCIHFTS